MSADIILHDNRVEIEGNLETSGALTVTNGRTSAANLQNDHLRISKARGNTAKFFTAHPGRLMLHDSNGNTIDLNLNGKTTFNVSQFQVRIADNVSLSVKRNKVEIEHDGETYDVIKLLKTVRDQARLAEIVEQMRETQLELDGRVRALQRLNPEIGRRS